MRTWRLRDRTLELNRRCLVLGIVNVTPDSFSDGGRHGEAAVAHALALVAQGADLLDVGGESTRPGSQSVSADEELRRVVPVIRALASATTVPLSVDTSKAAVARACLEVGAHIINDVTGLAGDPEMPAVVRDFGAGAIVMHMQGTPATMQTAPHYDDVTVDLSRYFAQRLESLSGQWVAPDAITLDPGIGFGKTTRHNLEIIARLATFQVLDRPVCLGVSRKGFLGSVLGRPVDERLAGSLTAAAFALARGAVQILRVHDVAATGDLVRLWEAIDAAGGPSA